MINGIKITGFNFMLNGTCSEALVISSPLGSDLLPMVHSGKFCSYRSKSPHKLGDKLFSISFYFEDGLLRSLHLTPFGMGASGWHDATAEKLKETKTFNDKWINTEFGILPGQSLPWAKIESTYDEKTWSAEIIITFR